MAEKLKALLADLAGVPEALHGYYDKTDEGYVLGGVDDKAYKSKLDEFRTNARTKHTEAETLRQEMKKFEGVDPEKHRKALQALEKLENDEERKAIEAGNIDEVIAKRTEAMRADFEKQRKALEAARDNITQEREQLRTRLGSLVIDQDAQVALGQTGVKVRQGALPDILSRAREVWKIDESGSKVPRKGGETVFGKDGSPLTMEEWAASLVDDAPHLFEGGSGGGAAGGERTDHRTNVIRKTDDAAFIENLDDIAKGKIRVE